MANINFDAVTSEELDERLAQLDEQQTGRIDEIQQDQAESERRNLARLRELRDEIETAKRDVSELKAHIEQDRGSVTNTIREAFEAALERLREAGGSYRTTHQVHQHDDSAPSDEEVSNLEELVSEARRAINEANELRERLDRLEEHNDAVVAEIYGTTGDENTPETRGIKGDVQYLLGTLYPDGQRSFVTRDEVMGAVRDIVTDENGDPRFATASAVNELEERLGKHDSTLSRHQGDLDNLSRLTAALTDGNGHQNWVSQPELTEVGSHINYRIDNINERLTVNFGRGLAVMAGVGLAVFLIAWWLIAVLSPTMGAGMAWTPALWIAVPVGLMAGLYVAFASLIRSGEDNRSNQNRRSPGMFQRAMQSRRQAHQTQRQQNGGGHQPSPQPRQHQNA